MVRVRVTPSANLIGQIYPPFDHTSGPMSADIMEVMPGQRNGERTTDSAHAQAKPVLRSNAEDLK